MKNTFRHGQLKTSQVADDELILIGQFKGIDLSSAIDKIETDRGIYSINYEWRDNRPQKRQGYSHIGTVSSISFAYCDFGNYGRGNEVKENNSLVIVDNPVRINGIWHFVAEDGNEHFVAHVGYLLYEIKHMDTIPAFEPIYPNGTPQNATGTTNPLLYKFENYKSMKCAVVGKKCLWFLGGNKFVRIRFKSDGKGYIEPVAESEFSFVPTTMIGITYDNAIAAGRNGLDYPNVMTKWRKNMLLSGVGKSETTATAYPGYRYVLDAPIVFEDEVADMAKVRLTIKTGTEE